MVEALSELLGMFESCTRLNDALARPLVRLRLRLLLAASVEAKAAAADAAAGASMGHAGGYGRGGGVAAGIDAAAAVCLPLVAMRAASNMSRFILRTGAEGLAPEAEDAAHLASTSRFAACIGDVPAAAVEQVPAVWVVVVPPRQHGDEVVLCTSWEEAQAVRLGSGGGSHDRPCSGGGSSSGGGNCGGSGSGGTAECRVPDCGAASSSHAAASGCLWGVLLPPLPPQLTSAVDIYLARMTGERSFAGAKQPTGHLDQDSEAVARLLLAHCCNAVWHYLPSGKAVCQGATTPAIPEAQARLLSNVCAQGSSSSTSTRSATQPHGHRSPLWPPPLAPQLAARPGPHAPWACGRWPARASQR